MVSHVKLCLLELMATDHCNLGCSEDNPRLTVFPFPPACKRSTIISASPTQLNGPIFQYLSQFEVFLNPQTPPEMPLLLQTTFSVKLCTSLKTANSLWSQSPRSLDAVLVKWEASVFWIPRSPHIVPFLIRWVKSPGLSRRQFRPRGRIFTRPLYPPEMLPYPQGRSEIPRFRCRCSGAALHPCGIILSMHNFICTYPV